MGSSLRPAIISHYSPLSVFQWVFAGKNKQISRVVYDRLRCGDTSFGDHVALYCQRTDPGVCAGDECCISLGMLPTINAVVAPFAVPKELLGVAVGAIFFFQMVGGVVSPAMLSFAQSSATDLEGGLKLVFLVSAIALAIALLLIMTIPEISLGAETIEESELSKSTASNET